MENANLSSLTLRNELSHLDKKMEIELWLENNRSVNSLVSSDNEFEEEIEIEEDEEKDDLEYFNTFPTIEELGYHEWLLKNPRPSWISAKVRTGNLNNIKSHACTWMAFGGNTRDLDSLWEETDDITTIHEFQYQKNIQWLEKASQSMATASGGSSDGVRILVTTSKFINDVNARTKKPKLVPISTRKPTKNANQSVATPHKEIVASETTIQKSRSYFRMLYEKTSKAWTWWIEKHFLLVIYWALWCGVPLNHLVQVKEKGDPCIFVGYATQSKGYKVYNKRTRLIVESIHINFDELKEVMMSDDNTSSLVPQQKMVFDHNSSNLTPQRQKVSDYDSSGLAPQLQKTSVQNSTELEIQDNSNEPSSSKLVPNVVPTTDEIDTSLQELKLLFSPMYEEYFNRENKSVSMYSALFDNLQQQDTQPTLNVQPTLELIIPPTDDNAKEINTDNQKM
ncbi:hypothetical protein Tco_0278582 [Tanacetum coccineum]